MWSRAHKMLPSTLYVTNAFAKFEAAMSNGLGGDAFTRKYIVWPWPWGEGHTKCSPVTSTSCDLCTCIVWSGYVQRLGRRCIYKKIHYMTFDLGVKVMQNIAQYPLHHVSYAATKFEVATSKRLRGDTFTRKSLFDLWPWLLSQGHRKCYPVPTTRGWTGGYPTPTSLPLSPHFPPPFTPLPSPSPPTSLPLQPHFPPPVRFFPPPDKILFLFMNLSVARNQN